MPGVEFYFLCSLPIFILGCRSVLVAFLNYCKLFVIIFSKGSVLLLLLSVCSVSLLLCLFATVFLLLLFSFADRDRYSVKNPVCHEFVRIFGWEAQPPAMYLEAHPRSS